MLSCSLGIFAYNEEKNIGKLLDAVKNQKFEKVKLEEIIVVSSNSTDRTDEIVREYAQKDSRLKLIVQKEREGKSSAINLFLKEAKSEIVLIESADTIPAQSTIEKMVLPFQDPKVGMAGGKPTPVNDPKTFIGFAVCMLWRLHHKMSMISPKLGEMAAFRNIVREIPANSAVDEASIEAIIRKQDLQLEYVPDAIVYNKGPENVADFLRQRRRIYEGHLWLQEKQNYKVSSQDSGLIIRLTLQELSLKPIINLKVIFTMLLEVWGRFLGWFDFKILKKNPFIWDISDSTKDLRQ